MTTTEEQTTTHILYFAGVLGAGPHSIATSLTVTQACGTVVEETDETLSISLAVLPDRIVTVGKERIVARAAAFTSAEVDAIALQEQARARRLAYVERTSITDRTR